MIISRGSYCRILDNIGGFTAGLASLPDGWVVTTNLRYRSLRPLVAERSSATATVLRRGRRAVVTNIVFEADGQRFGDGVLTSAVLSPESGLPSWNRPVSIERTSLDEIENAQHFLEAGLGWRHSRLRATPWKGASSWSRNIAIHGESRMVASGLPLWSVLWKQRIPIIVWSMLHCIIWRRYEPSTCVSLLSPSLLRERRPVRGEHP